MFRSIRELVLRKRSEQAAKSADDLHSREGARRRIFSSQQRYLLDIAQDSQRRRLQPRALSSSGSGYVLSQVTGPSCGYHSHKVFASTPSRPASSAVALILCFMTLLIPGLLDGGSNRGLMGITFVNAVSCFPNATGTVEVLNISTVDDIDLTSLFDCEDGEFEIILWGSVTVNDNIQIGSGTKVSIVGNHDNGLLSDYNGEKLVNPDYGSGASTNATAETGSIDSEIIAGTAFGPMFFLENASLHLENITLRNGNATTSTSSGIVSGGGLHSLDADITIAGCTLEDMFAEYWGAGIFANRSRIVVRDTLFRRCASGIRSQAGQTTSSRVGGGDVIGVGGGIATDQSDLLVDHCVFEECYASRLGGAIQTSIGNATVRDSIFWKTEAGSNNVEDEDPIGEGGSISTYTCDNEFEGNNGACLVQDCSFYHSRAGKKGGVILVLSGSKYPARTTELEFSRCLVVNASSGQYLEDDPQGEGGAVAVNPQQTVTIRDSTFTDNWAGKKGAAMVLSSSETDSWDSPGGTIVIINSTFEGGLARGSAGAVAALGKFSTLNITGNSSRFLDNAASDEGGVVTGPSNSRINVEGGYFMGNTAGHSGGVIESSGEVTISGGEYVGNYAKSGGVFAISDGGTLIIHNGTYSYNGADNGGVVDAEDAEIKITGGTFRRNKADFGGFLHTEGSGNATCSGALVQKNRGLDGGALYIVGANLMLQCDLVENDALVGPAIYARDNSTVMVQDVLFYDNTISRGSMVFLVSSDLVTYKTEFHDPVGYSDLSAVQADETSTYTAESTTFRGFEGEAVVFSEGTLYLDYCDFSESSASVLVEGQENSTFVRNAILGDDNYATPVEEASSSAIPNVDSIINFNTKCTNESGFSICSEGSSCIEGDLGVYCQCYSSRYSEEEVCINASPEWLNLSVLADPGETYYPGFIGADLILMFPSDYGGSGLSDSGNVGVIWNASALVSSSSSSESPGIIEWTVFPSTGLLLAGQSIALRVVGAANSEFDGKRSVTFGVDIMESTMLGEQRSLIAGTGASEGQGSVLQMSASSSSPPSSAALEVSMDAIFYHCTAGNFWDIDELECKVCADADVGENDGLNCSEPGVSTITLPLRSGYWRADLSITTIRECLNEEACLGGSSVEEVNYYCSDGYQGPFCAVCASGFGRGVANACHKCTRSFKEAMYVVVVLAVLMIIVVGGLLVIFLVGGTGAVTSTLDTTRESVHTLRRRSSDLLAASIGSTIPVGTSSYVTQTTGGRNVSKDASGNDADLSTSQKRTLRRFGSTSNKPGSCGLRCGYAGKSGRTSSIGVVDFSDGDPGAGSESDSKAQSCPPSKTPLDQNNSRLDDGWEIYNPGEGKVSDSSTMARVGTKGTSSARLSRESVCDTDGNIVLSSEEGGIRFTPLRGRGGVQASMFPKASSRRDQFVSSRRLQWQESERARRRSSRRSMRWIDEQTPNQSHDSVGDIISSPKNNRGSEWDRDDSQYSLSDGDRQGRQDEGIERSSSKRQDGGDSGDPHIEVGGRVAKSSSYKQSEMHAGRPVKQTATHNLAAQGATLEHQNSVKSSREAGNRREEEKKNAATRIGDFLAKLPLSKLKIVIVVWQITSSFADITHIPFPPIYERFLETIGIFTFDLGWIFSASCLTTRLTFYDKLLIVTIGPMVLFCALGITFYVGSKLRLTNSSGSVNPSSEPSNSVRHFRPDLASPDKGRSQNSKHGVCRSPFLPRSDGQEGGGVLTASSGITDVKGFTPAFAENSAMENGASSGVILHATGTSGNPGERPRRSRRSSREAREAGPGDEIDPEKTQLLRLFARHTTMSLIILYLVYSQVSTVVFQTFSCYTLAEINKSYMWADFRIECNTPEHRAYMVYAGIMIVIYPFGIPAAFWYFLNRQRTGINPKVHEHSDDLHKILDKKMEIRKNDKTVTPTSFLWAAYLPSRYYYEVVECMRRLLLTGLLVFMVPDSPEQVAIGCIFAFLSLLAFELLRPHVDMLDLQLYRTGCLVIFFSNFLALIIKAEVTHTESSSSQVFAAILIIVNILFFLSIFWNTYASMKVMLSNKHVQDNLFGVDIVPEKQMDEILRPNEDNSNTVGFGSFLRWGQRRSDGDVKSLDETLEARPAWERCSSDNLAVGKSPDSSSVAPEGMRVVSQRSRLSSTSLDVSMAAPRPHPVSVE